MSDLQLYTEILSLPDNLKEEVSHFVEFLKEKSKKANNLKERQYGCAKGFFTVAPDFDEPLDDFKEYM